MLDRRLSSPRAIVSARRGSRMRGLPVGSGAADCVHAARPRPLRAAPAFRPRCPPDSGQRAPGMVHVRPDQRKVVRVVSTEGSTYGEIRSSTGEIAILRAALEDAIRRLAESEPHRSTIDPQSKRGHSQDQTARETASSHLVLVLEGYRSCRGPIARLTTARL